MNKKLLKEVLSIQTYSGQEKQMELYIKQYCKSKKYTCTMTGNNIYITKGKADLYPCFVAHTDTVHKIIKDARMRLNVIEHNDCLFAIDNDCSQVGIGGDDKVGIYIALRMLERLPNCKVALFHSEEIGCIGSRSADVSFFADCMFALQADRRGYGDWITQIGGADISSKEFQSAVKPIISKFKYKFTSGAMTDVEALSQKGIGICCANVSCGYYRPHTDSEYVVMKEVDKVEQMFYAIATKLEKKKYAHTYTHHIETYGGSTYAKYKKYVSQYALYDDWYDEPVYHTDLKSKNSAYDDDKYITDNQYGLLKESPLYCRVCIDTNVYERMGNHYFRFVCLECNTLHDSSDALAFDEAMALLYQDSINK